MLVRWQWSLGPRLLLGECTCKVDGGHCFYYGASHMAVRLISVPCLSGSLSAGTVSCFLSPEVFMEGPPHRLTDE